jgi:hypothetical protein
LLLLTLAFILWAYGMYALFCIISQRKGGHLRGRSRWRRCGWLILAGSLGTALGLICWLSYTPEQQDHRLKLAGFLGTVYAEGWPEHVDRPPEYLLEKNQAQDPGKQPIYALLHPETPPTQVVPEKKVPKPRPTRQHTVEKAPGTAVKGIKAATPPAKKDKLAAKSRSKKKKRSASRGRKKASSS